MAKTEMMTIAFPNGGIIPGEITGGVEKPVSAHEGVEVPKAYGEQLVSDRFAYEVATVAQPEPLTAAQRKKLEARLDVLRAEHDKAADDEQKAKLSSEIAEVVAQLG